jgi:hypothetical protein
VKHVLQYPSEVVAGAGDTSTAFVSGDAPPLLAAIKAAR